MPGSRARRNRAPEVAVWLVTLLLVSVGPASAREADDSGANAPALASAEGHDSHLDHSSRPWLSVGVFTGSTQLDAHLADYQWDTSPRFSWGAQTLLGLGRWAAGIRLWRTQTTQEIATPSATTTPTVRATSLELVGQARILTVWGTQLLATASAGRLHLGYQPDQVTIQPSGSGSPIVVDMKPIDEWVGGAGLALDKALAGPWSAGLGVDVQMFGLDAAHRNGNTIEVRRETLHDWSARLHVAWTHRGR